MLFWGLHIHEKHLANIQRPLGLGIVSTSTEKLVLVGVDPPFSLFTSFLNLKNILIRFQRIRVNLALRGKLHQLSQFFPNGSMGGGDLMVRIKKVVEGGRRGKTSTSKGGEEEGMMGGRERGGKGGGEGRDQSCAKDTFHPLVSRKRKGIRINNAVYLGEDVTISWLRQTKDKIQCKK